MLVQISEDVELSKDVISAAICVHRALGPGLLESIYQKALELELRHRGLTARSQVEVPVMYRGQLLGIGLRIDLLVNESLVLELKSVARLDDVHTKQLITYLRCTGLKRGLLINFHGRRLVDGIKRVSV
jgi:GxxExxY protein